MANIQATHDASTYDARSESSIGNRDCERTSSRRVSQAVCSGVILLLSASALTGCSSLRIYSLRITSISPSTGLPGTVIEIQGSGFSPNPYDNTVMIGGSRARVISGTTTALRVVALRDVATGPVTVKTGNRLASSQTPFRRAGSTTRATPLMDSDAELVTGVGNPHDPKYDMVAQGLGQRVLVVLATPKDVDPEALAPTGKSARDALVDQLLKANTFFWQSSYSLVSTDFSNPANGTTNFGAVTPGWIPLSQVRDFYFWQQEDIDRAQAVVDAAQAQADALKLDPNATASDLADAQKQVDEAKAKLRTAQDALNKLQEPDFLFAEALTGAKAAVADFDTYTDYVVIVAGPFARGANYGSTTQEHAESQNPNLQLGPFDVQFPGERGIIYVTQQASWGRIAHELSHFFAGGDLYSERYADGSTINGNAERFDLMGAHDEEPLYSAYTINHYLHYIDESSGGNVTALDWGSQADLTQNVDIVAHAMNQDPPADGTVELLRLKVSDGLYYYAEVRQRPDPTFGSNGDYVFDAHIPLDVSTPAWGGGVIMTRAVENNNQSNNNDRPITLLPPGRMMQVGDAFVDPARTIRITVTQKLADRPAKYRLRVEWGHLPAADPNGQFDLRITPWTPGVWETPDIWANSPKNDETSPAKVIYANHAAGDETQPIGNGDPPWVGHDNSLFAVVTNQGMVATPEHVIVTFYVNTPPGVGDNGTWAPFTTMDIGALNPGERRIVQADQPWRPRVGEHTCVKVYIQPMTGEVTFGNNEAQENFSQFETGAASPYDPVEFSFLARNPYTAPGVMDMRAKHLPTNWFVAFDHGSVFLPALGEKLVHVVIWTDRTSEWLGGESRDSVRKPIISIEGQMDRWGDQIIPVGGVAAFVQAVRKVSLDVRTLGDGARDSLVVVGQVAPAIDAVSIAIHITAPDGTLHVERTTTSNTGQFRYRMHYQPRQPGIYRIQGFVLPGSLASQAESTPRSFTVH